MKDVHSLFWDKANPHETEITSLCTNFNEYLPVEQMERNKMVEY